MASHGFSQSCWGSVSTHPRIEWAWWGWGRPFCIPAEFGVINGPELSSESPGTSSVHRDGTRHQSQACQMLPGEQYLLLPERLFKGGIGTHSLHLLEPLIPKSCAPFCPSATLPTPLGPVLLPFHVCPSTGWTLTPSPLCLSFWGLQSGHERVPRTQWLTPWLGSPVPASQA